MMNQFSQVEKLFQKGTMPVHYVTCKDGDGRDCYYFLLASKEQIKALDGLTEADGIKTIHDYGKVIACGFGSEPSPEVKAQLKEEYDFEY